MRNHQMSSTIRVGWFLSAWLINILFLSMLTGSFIVKGASTITLTPSTTYQTIDGFGAWVGAEGECNPQFGYDSVGFSLCRLDIVPSFQPNNNMADATNADLTKFSVSSLSGHIATINAVKAHPDALFFGTCISPPEWMKDLTQHPYTGGTCTSACGGILNPAFTEAFAGFLSAYCQIIKARTGVDIYAISIANEPAFVQFWNSCYYDPIPYKNTLKAVGARFAKDGVKAKLIGAEDMLNDIYTRPYIPEINNDPVAKGYLYAVAVHGYTNGVNPIPSSSGVTPWLKAGNLASSMGKQFWMTETSGQSQTSWSNAIGLASNLYMSMNYGNLSAWVWFYANACGNLGLLCNNKHTLLSLSSSQYYKFIRPGAVRIKSVVTGDAIYPVAFLHSQKNTLSIVIINQGNATQLQLAGVPSQFTTFTKYTTTSTKKRANEGTVSVNSTNITIDASSVTTLFAQGPVGISQKEVPHHSALRISKKGCRYFHIDGSLMNTRTSRGHGICIKTEKINGCLSVAPAVIITK
jgi:O-glycosyl hydrolase